MAAAIAMSSFAVAGCSDGDIDYGMNGLLITGTGSSNVQRLVVEDVPTSYPITVSATRKVSSDVDLTLAIDTSLVQEYNAKNGTNFYAVPAGSVELASNKLKIEAGSTLSNSTTVNVVNTDNFQQGRTYMIPVTITSSTGGGANVIEASRTMYIRISRIISFYALENDYNASSNFIFDDSKRVDLSNYTIEFKIYPYSLGTGTAGDNQIQRVLSVEGKGEEEANMFRFGESGLQRNQLQWILPGGRAASNTLFSNNKWYTVSCTYDGTTFIMYVNGVKDCETTGAGKVTPFQRFELGMSWGGGYPAGQFFHGRMCEIRVWNRALGASEIANGLSGVDPHSKGLVAYWKMDQASGPVITDATGNGYDMDWTKSQRDMRENGVLVGTPDAANHLKFVKDDNNKAAQ